MGHLTRIANNVAASLEKGPNNELLQSLFNGKFTTLSLFKFTGGGVVNSMNIKEI